MSIVKRIRFARSVYHIAKSKGETVDKKTFMRLKWTESSECKSLRHCKTCRNNWNAFKPYWKEEKPRCPRKLERLWFHGILGRSPQGSPIGAGDRLHRIFQILKISNLVHFMEQKTGKGCGCETRRRLMNQHGILRFAMYWLMRKI